MGESIENVWESISKRTSNMYKWCEEQDRRRFRITPAPHSYLRLYLKSSSAAVVVPFDTAGSDIYKLLYMMSKTRFHDYLSMLLVTGSVIQAVAYDVKAIN